MTEDNTIKFLNIIYNFTEQEIIPEYGGKIYELEIEKGNKIMMIMTGVYNMGITRCPINDTDYVIKIEHFAVHEEYRYSGIGTSYMKELMVLADRLGVILGCWVKEDNDKLIDWYEGLGFKFIEKQNDLWYEYKGGSNLC